MKIPGLPNKSYRRSDAAYLSEQDILDIISMRNTIPNAAQIAAKKYKTSATRIYQIWKMQGEIKQQHVTIGKKSEFIEHQPVNIEQQPVTIEQSQPVNIEQQQPVNIEQSQNVNIEKKSEFIEQQPVNIGKNDEAPQ